MSPERSRCYTQDDLNSANLVWACRRLAIKDIVQRGYPSVDKRVADSIVDHCSMLCSVADEVFDDIEANPMVMAP